MKRFLEIVKSRTLKHWQTSLKGLVYGVLTWMLVQRHITVTEWIAGVGSILSINAIFLQKDSGKVANKVNDPDIPDAQP
jgi:hypothetical protein